MPEPTKKRFWGGSWPLGFQVEGIQRVRVGMAPSRPCFPLADVVVMYCEQQGMKKLDHGWVSCPGLNDVFASFLSY